MFFCKRHIVDLASILFLYAGMFAAFYGWGRLGLAILKLNQRSVKSIFAITWLGFVLVLVVLQAVHLFVPIDWKVSTLVYGVGLAISLPVILKGVQNREATLNFNIFLYALLILFFASWVASRSMLPPMNYDSGLYHFNTIRWINSYPIIPGLGNLHDRLAFNQSFFSYAASLNFFPYFPYCRSIANSFLLVIIFAQVTWRLFGVPWRLAEFKKTDPLVYLPYLFVLPVLVHLAIRSNVGLDSPTPDLASALIQLYIFIMLVQVVHDINTGRWCDGAGMVLTVVAIAAITIKLNNLVFSLLIVSICLVCLLLFSPSRSLLLNKIVRLALVCSAIGIVWMTRGYILSGYPLFPSTVGAIPVDWAVPTEVPRNIQNWIYSWGRAPGVDCNLVVGNWNWFAPWFARMIQEVEDVMYPTISSLFAISCFFFALIYAGSRNKHLPNFFELILLVPSTLGLVFWFFTAPDPRFAQGIFWSLSIGFMVVLLSYLHCLFSCRAFVLVVSVIFFTSSYFFVRPSIDAVYARTSVSSDIKQVQVESKISDKTKSFYSIRTLRKNGDKKSPIVYKKVCGISVSGFHPIETVSMVAKSTMSGLVVYLARDSQCFWDSPIPATVIFNPNLRLRVAGRIESGFTVKKQEDAVKLGVPPDMQSGGFNPPDYVEF